VVCIQLHSTRSLLRCSATSLLASQRSTVAIQLTAMCKSKSCFCGICHYRSPFGPQRVERVHGHELSDCPRPRDCRPRYQGRVGSHQVQARGFAAVGCMVDSDGTCAQCKAGLEMFLPNMILNLQFRRTSTSEGVTYGGYSESIVVDEHFVLRLPSNLNLSAAAPMLCAGITTYSPMHHWGSQGQESWCGRKTQNEMFIDTMLSE